MSGTIYATAVVLKIFMLTARYYVPQVITAH